MVDVGSTLNDTFCNWLLVLFSRGRQEEMEEAAVVSWSIWLARNDFVWQQKSRTAANVVASARTLLDQYKFAQKRKGLSLSPLIDGDCMLERWPAPAINKIKVNVDGALFEREGRFGFDCVTRDSSGNLVEVYTMGKVGRVQPEIAEIVGIKEALSWIDRHLWGQVILETDSLVCVQAV
ncbi:hypothetical protein CsatB_005615 [Cannabis sativa]|uniref:uncharacterized protein LOC133032062 n=1 Tax=Cannabis sativa TaxID=3483 RepID=UPI0029CA8180|nr:uncharacterized protein LOC133032062 [Cannabis sativa]